MSSNEKDSAWLDENAVPPSVRGFAEAAELLNDGRLKTDYYDIFTAAGANQGLAGEAGRRSLLNLHGQEHKRLRSEIAPEFRPRAADRVRPFSRTTAAELCRAFPEAQPFEFMQDFAKPYIERTTADFMGIPQEDIQALSQVVARMSEAATQLRRRAAELDKGAEHMVRYAMAALEKRRADPTDDVIGRLSVLVDKGAIDELFAANLVGTVLSAGLEPSILQLGVIVEELSRRPDTWRTLSQEPSLVPRVLEEGLRFRSTNPGVVRACEAEVAQREKVFKAGARVHISISGANHDARRYARPYEFDVEANTGSHMAFGFGPHHCLGAPLVRAQLQEALTVLVQTLECPELLEVQTKPDHGPAGPAKLLLRVSKRPGA